MREYEILTRATPIENYYLSFENKFFSKNLRFLSLSKDKIKYHEEIIRANQFEFYLPNGVSIPSVIHFYTKNTLNLSGFLTIKLENSENLPNFVKWKISKNNLRINLKSLKYLIGPLKIIVSAEGFKDDDQVDFYLSPIKNGIDMMTKISNVEHKYDVQLSCFTTIFGIENPLIMIHKPELENFDKKFYS